MQSYVWDGRLRGLGDTAGVRWDSRSAASSSGSPPGLSYRVVVLGDPWRQTTAPQAPTRDGGTRLRGRYTFQGTPLVDLWHATAITIRSVRVATVLYIRSMARYRPLYPICGTLPPSIRSVATCRLLYPI